ncbi:MAG: Gfo/Idh/MocA family oxidoreductase [Bryobacterales bacterium]|nr:Gfo/Idh/MocA family oxidoreductase [Bryobacterales bacterium]
MKEAPNGTRRGWLKSAGGRAFPAIVPSTVFGQSAPSNRIQVAQIGCGRIARHSEFPGVLKHHGLARFVAVADVDAVRADDARTNRLEEEYGKRLVTGKYSGIKTYEDYREMLADQSIDADDSTPDHRHAQPAMEEVGAGQGYLSAEAASLTIAEGRHMADVLRKTGRILQPEASSGVERIASGHRTGRATAASAS